MSQRNCAAAVEEELHFNCHIFTKDRLQFELIFRRDSFHAKRNFSSSGMCALILTGVTHSVGFFALCEKVT